MYKLPRLIVVLALGAFCLSADSSLGPVLQWVKTIGGSGNNQVTAAAADAKGNLYITGNTSSVDFPVTSAIQRNAGGSTLVRINAATSAAQKLYPAGLSGATSIQVDPQNPQILYATQGNAIWRSADGGDTWGSLPAFPPDVTVYFVAVDPVDNNTMYAATRQQGFFKSTDGGQTWRAINSGIPTARDGNINAFRVWADPKIPQVVFASTGVGLLRSANGGESWAISSNSSFGTLAFDRLSLGTLYLLRGTSISKSTDDGMSFTTLSTLPDQSPPIVLIADPLHAGILYAGSYGGIFQSTDGGATWTKKASGQCVAMAADPNNPVLYANISSYGIVRSTDGFNTLTPIGPPEMTIVQIAVGGPSVFVVASPSTDAFVVKLDSDGNVVYSTYFGGSARDSSVAMALGSDGSVYVTGATASIDFPTTAGAYATVAPTSNINRGSNFVFKLNPDGSLAWSTYFADFNTTVATIALDSAGNLYIAGSSNGGLPTTAGAYQTQFTRNFSPCGPGNIGPCPPGPASAFVTKLDSSAAGLIYSTYVPTAARKEVVQNAQALVVDANGNAYFAGLQNVVMLNAAGSAVPASTVQPSVNFSALALDSTGNLYATGSTSGNSSFPATAGAFQTAPQPATPNLPGQRPPGGGGDAFVIKWDANLSLLAATLLGGESVEAGESIAIDGSGNVIVSGETDSKSFPTRALFQTSFSSRSGFVAGLDSSLSHLLFSTYVGDVRPFNAQVAVPDGSGNILMVGSTLTAAEGLFFGGDPGGSYTVANLVIANKIALPPAPAARLDTVVNFAGRQAGALAPGEAIEAIGSGFGAEAQLLIDGSAVPLVSGTANNLVAVMPDGAKTSGAFQVQVSTGGMLSNPVFLPAGPASPGIYSVDGTGYGQGYILNSDGTLNSSTNPVAPGSAITIFATGAGQFNLAGPFAVTTLPAAVFIDNFYALGIAAIEAPVAGIPGNVYQLGVYVPDPAKLVNNNPNLLNFKLPPQVGVKLVFGAVNPLNPDNSAMISQGGLVLNVKQ
jgi:uncharacterized protein (TIGR03437 family)